MLHYHKVTKFSYFRLGVLKVASITINELFLLWQEGENTFDSNRDDQRPGKRLV